MENGETKPQIMARSRHIILMHKSKWNAQQQTRAVILFRMFPKLEEAYNIYLELVDIFNKKSKPAEARLNLARWYNKVEAFGDDGFSKVIETFENHNATIVGQRIYPVGKAWLIKNKVVPLQHESYPTAACHPSGCADRQL